MARWQFFVAKENWLAAWDWVHIHHIHPPPTVKVSAVKVLKQDSVLLEAGCVCLRQDSPGRVMWFCWMASPTSFAHCRIDSGSQSSRLQQSVRHKSYTNSPMPGEGRVETNKWPQCALCRNYNGWAPLAQGIAVQTGYDMI